MPIKNISVIIVNYNTKDLLKNCLKSLEKHHCGLSLEIFIVDNGSSDSSVDYLKTLKNKNNIDYIVIFNGKNLGFAKACNQAIDYAKGKYVLLLNSDTLIKDNSLKLLYEFAEKHPKAGIVAPQLLNGNKSIQDSCYNFPTLKNAIKEFIFGEKGSFLKFYPDTNKPVIVEAVVGAAMLIPQKVINLIGKLDEKFFMYYEDIEYCKRIWQNGMKVYYLPSAQIIHLHGKSAQKSDKKNSFKKSNDILIESSKKYNGLIKYHLLNIIIKVGSKLAKK
jgi:GT2 family glycosyltransferase